MININFKSRAGNNYQSEFIISLYDKTTAINNKQNEVPTDFELCQNYPNPFNPITTIKYSVPKRSKVTLKIFDILWKRGQYSC